MEMNNIIFKSPSRDGGNKVENILQGILDGIKKEIKNRKDLNQKKVAKKIGVSPSEFSKILNDDRPFKVNHLIKIANALDVKTEDLLANPKRIDMERMPMIYMIRTIVQQEIEKYLKEG